MVNPGTRGLVAAARRETTLRDPGRKNIRSTQPPRNRHGGPERRGVSRQPGKPVEQSSIHPRKANASVHEGSHSGPYLAGL